MTVYFVSTTGNDNNSGSQSLPFATFQKALSVMVAGDTLFIRGGTYSQAIRSPNIIIPNGIDYNTPVLISGFQIENPTLTGDSVVCIDIGTAAPKQYLIFQNFTIDMSSHGLNAIAVNVGIGTHHIRFQNVTTQSVHGGTGTTSTGANAYAGGANFIEALQCDIFGWQDYGFYVRGQGWLIDGCIIHNNGGYGIQIYDSGSNIVSSNTVRNCHIYGNGAAFFELTYALALTSGSENRAYNNIIEGHNIGGGVQLDYFRGGVNNRVYNNTIYGNAGDGIYIGVDAGTSIVQNNIVYGNGAAAINNTIPSTTTVDHNFTNDPSFVDSVNKDFRLQSTSAAINFGTDLSSFFTTDYLGNTRTVPFDAGAYEFTLVTIISITCDDSRPWVLLSTGVFANTLQMKTVNFSPYPGRWVCFKALSEVNGGPWTSCAELSILVSGRQIVPTAPIHLAWDYLNNPDPGITFKIYRQTNLTGGFILIGSVSNPTTEYFDTTAVYSNIYDYEVTAVSPLNPESLISNVVEYIPPRVGSIWCFDSEELIGEGANNGRAIHCIDGLTTTFWHTRWTSDVPPYPHNIVIDLGKPYTINGFTYLPRQDGGINGTVASYEFYVADYFIPIGRLMTLPGLQPMLGM